MNFTYIKLKAHQSVSLKFIYLYGVKGRSLVNLLGVVKVGTKSYNRVSMYEKLPYVKYGTLSIHGQIESKSAAPNSYNKKL